MTDVDDGYWSLKSSLLSKNVDDKFASPRSSVHLSSTCSIGQNGATRVEPSADTRWDSYWDIVYIEYIGSNYENMLG